MAEHGYGRIQGRKNRYSHLTNDIILDYMVSEQMKFDRSNFYKILGLLEPYEFKPHSLSTLFNVVRERIKSKVARSKVSWDTIIKHLEDLVNAHILTRETKAGRNNETYYRLTSLILRIRGRVRVKRLILSDGTIVHG